MLEPTTRKVDRQDLNGTAERQDCSFLSVVCAAAEALVEQGKLKVVVK